MSSSTASSYASTISTLNDIGACFLSNVTSAYPNPDSYPDGIDGLA